MSQKFPGGIISKTAPVPTGPYENGTAPGVWTLEQQAEFVKQGIWPTAGLRPDYIEDVFSTWLYTGNDSTQTITNGIDLAGKGGLVWQKIRSTGSNHFLTDSASGFNFQLRTNADSAQVDRTGVVTPTATGFSLNGTGGGNINVLGESVASWTFRKQPKFFDVVTFTTDSSGNAVVPHSLGSVPGAVIMKNTQDANNWMVYHRSLTSTSFYLSLNTTDAQGDVGATWINPTSTTVSFVGGILYASRTYVMYLFAHNAGGFGLTGTDNVISCGSYTGGADVAVNVGFEPQWVLTKAAGTEQNWVIHDTMRGYTVNATGQATLHPNNSDAEDFGFDAALTSTGFRSINSSTGVTYIYIAIRRGPMKVPTTGTSVYEPLVVNNAAGTTNTTGFPVDLQIFKDNRAGTGDNKVVDRLRGVNTTTTENAQPLLVTNSTAAEDSSAASRAWSNTGFQTATAIANSNLAVWNFRRAPGFFDVVCYTGTGSAMTVPHNLAAVPELMIVKSRSTSDSWPVYSAATGNSQNLFLNQTDAAASRIYWNNTTPTASVFSLGNSSVVSNSGTTYVAYLFATCPGVSKVGSYTGTATTQTIDCGFAGGARFVLVKRTDVAANWVLFDTARGMAPGSDYYLNPNTANAEDNANLLYTALTGFQVLSDAGAGLNASGGTYIFLAIA